LDLDGSTEQIARCEVERFKQPLLLTKAGTPDSTLASWRDIFRLSEAYHAFLTHSENQVLLSSFEAPKRRMSNKLRYTSFSADESDSELSHRVLNIKLLKERRIRNGRFLL
jgi:hypothetical protein